MQRVYLITCTQSYKDCDSTLVFNVLVTSSFKKAVSLLNSLVLQKLNKDYFVKSKTEDSIQIVSSTARVSSYFYHIERFTLL